MTFRAEFELLREVGVSIGPGLGEQELARVEEVIGARLPPDLRAFLSEGLPRGERFPNFRDPDSTAFRDRLARPFEGIAFDVQHNAFWWREWGARPRELAEALEIARAHVESAPRLVPIAGHRYLPCEPALAGNPVFSVHQTDIIYYGADLATYLRHEFRALTYAEAVHDGMRRIRFWSDLVDANG